jgi:hypothetical protein
LWFWHWNFLIFLKLLMTILKVNFACI